MRISILLISGILSLSLFSCRTNVTDNQTGIAGASWITDSEPPIMEDSLLYGDHPASRFIKRFRVNGKIKSAELQITAAGYYESRINGIKSGEQRLDPAWTDFSERIYFRRIDVTSAIKRGNNSWLVDIGNGFYNPLPMKMWGNLNLRKHLPVGKPGFTAALIITLESGKKLEIWTDESWKYSPGPIVRNSVYLGEWYDANRESDPLKISGKRSGWLPVQVTSGPGGRLIESFFPPITVTKWIQPVSIKGMPDNRTIVDFGRNFAGIVRLKINAREGDTIRLRYGERIYPDGSLNPMTAVCGQIKRAGVGGPGSPALAQQEDLFISAGREGEIFEPKFTFHGFRYLEISGLSYIPVREDVLGARMNTAIQETTLTLASDPYLNTLDEICGWTFLSNLFSVQSDCPAREKFGYGGDINATAEAYIYNYDMSRIYRKTVYDWVDAMESGRFVDTAPYVGLGYCGISWESAFLNIQYWLWLHYQDSLLVKEFYEQDKIWMDKAARLHPDGIVDQGLSDHESLGAASVELTGSCHYLQAARIMEQFAVFMNQPADAKNYSDLGRKIKEKIADRFWNHWKRGTVYNDQTRLACLLDYDVLDEPARTAALEELITCLKKDDYHVKTGIFGTKALLNSLSESGRADIAYKVVSQPGFSGWRYMVDQGATTLWETWKESDNVFSQNHPMFGSVSEWYNKWIGGIMPDDHHPGSGRIIINPQIISGLDSVRTERIINERRFKSQWIRKDEVIEFFFEIPDGTTADWIPPKNALNIKRSDGKAELEMEPGPDGKNFMLRSGNHHFLVKLMQ